MKQTRGKCHCFASLLLTVSGRSFWNKWMYFVGLFVPCFWCKTHRRKQTIISLRKRCVCPSWGWSRLHVSFVMSTLTACFSNVRVVEFELKAWFYWHIGGIQPHKKRGRHSTDIQSAFVWFSRHWPETARWLRWASPNLFQRPLPPPFTITTFSAYYNHMRKFCQDRYNMIPFSEYKSEV